MKRWPIDNGRPVSPYEMRFTEPTPEDLTIRGLVTMHHGVYPWSALAQNAISMTYGSLRPHIFPMYAREHNMGRHNLHSEFSPPKLPNLVQMQDVIEEYLSLNGVIDCVCHKKTREQYQITAQQWARIRA